MEAAEGQALPRVASYEHTMMRVNSMSERALSNRVRSIERCAGQFAAIKMKIFAQVLKLERYEELTQDAEAALQRLLKLRKFEGKTWAQMLDKRKKKPTIKASESGNAPRLRPSSPALAK